MSKRRKPAETPIPGAPRSLARPKRARRGFTRNPAYGAQAPVQAPEPVPVPEPGA